MTLRGIVVISTVLAAAPAAHAICTANASPPVECKIKVPKKPKVRITRDGYGVPHLKARSLYDVGFGMGQGQAQDRLFQMELVRKSATGNVAELFGTDFLSDDIDARRQFYSQEELDALSTTVSCPVQTLVRGFVDGVNAYIAQIYGDTMLTSVPHEFFFAPTAIRLQGNGTIPTGVRYTIETIGGVEVYKPDAWRTTDVAAIGVLLAGRFGSGGGRQLRQAALLNYLTAKLGDPDVARQVFEDVRWVRDPDSRRRCRRTVPSTR
jgi:acyl-homoserine lactone acylase PvdQ